MSIDEVPVVKRYGEPSTGGEADAVLAAARAFYAARASADWDRVCGLMTPEARQALRRTSLTRGPGLKGKPCSEVMVAFVLGMDKSRTDLRQDNREIRFFEARIDGDRALALYRRSGGGRGILPVARVDGKWKVAAPAAVPLTG